MDAQTAADMAESLSASLFADGRTLALVVGPDAHVYDTGGPLQASNCTDASECLTIYDAWVDYLLPDRNPPAHSEYDIFLAAEMWQKLEDQKNSRSTDLYDNQRVFFNKFNNAYFPLLDQVSRLPFTYYVNFGFDLFVHENVKRYRSNARLISIRTDDDLINRWPRRSRATINEPWVINLLGRSDQESITTYSNLADLFTEILQQEFLPDIMRSDLKVGGILFLGIPLRYWYTRVLLLALRSDIKHGQRRRRAFELRSPPQPSEKDCMLMYSESTSGISTQINGYDEILSVLQLLEQKHRISTAFISYRHNESERMRPIRDYLEQNGIIVITSAEFERRTGESWQNIRTDAIRNSDCFIPIVTKDVAEDRRSDCWNELDIALEYFKGRDCIFPVTFDGISIDKVWGDKQGASNIQSISEDAQNLMDVLLERAKRCYDVRRDHDE